jgi:hypothetical protein
MPETKKKVNKAQGFEIAEYSSPEIGPGEMIKVIKQIMEDNKQTHGSHGIWCDMTGDLFKIHQHCYEMHLPLRMKLVEEQTDAQFKEVVKLIKKEFKARTKKTLNLTEKKELSNRTIEKVSLNERYYYKTWRFYNLSVS